MMTPEDSTALAAAQSLEGAMRDLSADLIHLRSYGRRNRILISVVAGVVVLLVLLGAGLAHTVKRADDAANEAKKASNGVEQTNRSRAEACAALNEQNGITKTLLSTILIRAYTPPPGVELPAALRRSLAKNLSDIKHAYAPRDCAKIGAA